MEELIGYEIMALFKVKDWGGGGCNIQHRLKRAQPICKNVAINQNNIDTNSRFHYNTGTISHSALMDF